MKNKYFKMMFPYHRKGSSCCCAVGCSMRSNTNLLSKIRMHSFPADPTRRRLWQIAVRRDNWEPKYTAKICSLHFITGKPSKDPEHPDYVPTIFSYNKDPVSVKEVERYDRRKRRREAIEESFSGIKKMQNSDQKEFIPTVFCWNEITIKDEDSEIKPKLKKCDTISRNNVQIENETEDEDLETLYLEYKALEKEKQELEKRLKVISGTSFALHAIF